MRSIFQMTLVSALATGILAGCSKSPPTTPVATAPPAATNAVVIKKFPTRGVIEEVQAAKNTLVVKHEEIPNYMPAMVMPIEVKPPTAMAGLGVGDSISFTLVDAGSDGWLEDLKLIAKAGTNAPIVLTNAPLTAKNFRQVRDVEILKVGDAVYDYPFTNELGQAISFSQYKGKALGITFIFTRCPFPTFCPRMSQNFQDAYKLLAASSTTNWHLLSLSFDPVNDTPEVLKKYASKYQYDPAKWNHATGAFIEIDALTEQLGLYFAVEGGTINHNLRTAIIDATGKLHKVFIGNEWKPEEFAAEMEKAAAVK